MIHSNGGLPPAALLASSLPVQFLCHATTPQFIRFRWNTDPPAFIWQLHRSDIFTSDVSTICSGRKKKINNKSCKEWAERRDLQLLKRGNGFVRRRLHNRYMSTLSSLSLGWWFYVCSLYVSKNWLSWSMFFKICGDDEYSDVKNSWSSVIRLILKILLAQI